MTAGTALVLILTAAVVVLAVVALVKGRGKGCSSCSGCSGCSERSGCRKEGKAQEKENLNG